jgi:cytochrome c
MKRIWLVVAALSAGLLLGGNEPRAELGTIDLTQWRPPDIGTLGDDPFGKLVKYGHKLFTDTANEIAPAVFDPAKRLAGNNLACSRSQRSQFKASKKLKLTVLNHSYNSI